jgi:hypothetical protein
MPSEPLLILGLAVSFGLPVVGYYRRGTAGDIDWSHVRRGLLLNWAVLVGLVGFAGLAVGPAMLGYRLPSVGVFVDGFLFGFIAFAGTMLLVAVAARLVGGLTADPTSLVVLEQPLHRRLAVAVTGATVETTLFYGFVVEAVRALGGGPWIAGAGAAGGLLLVRGRWETEHALQWLPGAVVLSAIALWTRTALVVFLVRLLYDTLTLASGEVDDYAPSADS